MSNKLCRITRDFRRVAQIDGSPWVITIGPAGLQLRRLGSRQATAVPVAWADLAREGGLLDAAELQSRPLLAAYVAANCNSHRSQEAGDLKVRRPGKEPRPPARRAAK